MEVKFLAVNAGGVAVLTQQNVKARLKI